MRLLCILVFLFASAVNAIVINPGDVIMEGNCTGTIDTFLCKCLNNNDTIDIQLSPGYHNFSKQLSCVLQLKASITIIGSSSNDTIIQCNDGFSIRFYELQNIAIHNLVLIGCGGMVSEPLGQYLFYFDGIRNVNITNLYLSNTVGYGIIVTNQLGPLETVTLLNVHISNSRVDDSCIAYDYDNNDADFSCSGSGIFIAYVKRGEIINSTLKINNCSFVNNINQLPKAKYDEFLGVVNTGYKGDNPLPLVGAASISIYYAQDVYNIATEISNTQFYNNSGTFSGSIAVVVFDSTKSTTVIENCTFNNSKGIYESSGNDPTTGGIYFINLGTLSTSQDMIGVEAEVLTIIKCDFLHLAGKMGVAFHIEKNSPDSILVIVRIEKCNFRSNEADSGSAIFAKDRSSSLSYRQVLDGSLNIHLTNINADHNVVLPGSTIRNVNNNFITGVFHISNCLVVLTCDEHCHFQHNQPSVFYGHKSALTISGYVLFMNNTARYGGAMRLIDTVLYIHTDTAAHFINNSALENGGAIEVEFSLSNIQSQDVCPFQFVGLPLAKTITDSNLTDIKTIMNIDVLFQSNYVRCNNKSCDVESIFANVFYVCSWYPDTSVLTQVGPNSEVTETGFRDAVYREAFNYGGDSIHGHLNISAIIPCVCNDNDNYSEHVTDCLESQPIHLSHKVIPGRPFSISVTSLDTVGSIGHSSELVSTAYNVSSGKKFVLDKDQVTRQFSVGDKRCIEVNFTVYVHTKDESLLSATEGNLTLSIAIPRFIAIPFSFVEKCPTGFMLDENDKGQYACMCNVFLTEVSNKGFSCDQRSGLVRPIRDRSWLAAINDDIQYVESCSPTLCDYDTGDVSLNLSATDHTRILCTSNHAGRACGECVDGYSKVFGSDSCKECNNAWLVTILLYAILGIVLIVILFLLKLTVTVGIINGLVFFCNVMSINEKLFFNENISRFSFLRLFISIFNLDLGFEICFYDGMNQVAKTGLQFVFPVYLWPLMIVIVYLSRWSHKFQSRVSQTSVPVFATLILLSYAKLLRTAISVFSFVDVKSSMTGTIRAWRPDPSVGYLEGGHIVLFIIATLFLLFIVPFAVSFTYPKILHYKKFTFLFPLFDSFVAPYKEKYRFWFGIRALILLYLALMETIIFADIEALLLSSITVVGTFAVIQAYIRPFKSDFINILDLAFTSNFLLISSIVLYINPTDDGYEKSDIVVRTLGYVAFVLFCVVIAYHIHYVSRKSYWYKNALEQFWNKVNIYRDRKWIRTFFSVNTIRREANLDRFHNMEDFDIPQENKFQESFYEQM